MVLQYSVRVYLTYVYNFDVVSLEIVSGMRKTIERPKEEFVYLLGWVYVSKEEQEKD